MKNNNIKKVTIVSERLLKEKLIAIIKESGATGYTCTACEGEGSRGDNPSDWEGRNVEIYTVVDEEVCQKILDQVNEQFMENFSIIAYVCDVSVVRHKKFSTEN